MKIALTIRRKRQKGIATIVVLVMLGVLAALVTVSHTSVAQTRRNLRNIETKHLEKYEGNATRRKAQLPR